MSTYQIFINSQPADAALYTALTSLEVEESMDLPGAVELTLPVVRTSDGNLTYLTNSRFAPMSNLAVVVTPVEGAAGAVGGLAGSVIAAMSDSPPGPQCIFDGFVLSHKVHLESGTTNSTVAIFGQDASWLMNLTEQAKEWIDVTDADVANTIFGNYGITPVDDNTLDDSPSHTESGHSLMQRGSDIQFLRMLARRNGKVCRVSCADQPGIRTGYFATPNLNGDPDVTLTLNDPENWTVDALDLNWDVARPSSVIARQALFTDSDPNGVSADTTDSGLPLLSARDWKLLGVLAYYAADNAVLWATFKAFGHAHPPIATLVMAYLIGSAAGSLPVPGGIGVVEGGMIGLLVLYGAPAICAGVAVLAYRAVSTGLPLALGGIALLAPGRPALSNPPLSVHRARAGVETSRHATAA